MVTSINQYKAFLTKYGSYKRYKQLLYYRLNDPYGFQVL